MTATILNPLNVQDQLRRRIHPPLTLTTPVRSAPFVVQEFTERGVVLLLGKKRAWTLIPWHALDELISTLQVRSRMRVAGSGYSTDLVGGTVDGLLKKYVNRATAGWVVALLETADLLEIDRSRPMSVRRRVSP